MRNVCTAGEGVGVVPGTSPIPCLQNYIDHDRMRIVQADIPCQNSTAYCEIDLIYLVIAVCA